MLKIGRVICCITLIAFLVTCLDWYQYWSNNEMYLVQRIPFVVPALLAIPVVLFKNVFRYYLLFLLPLVLLNVIGVKALMLHGGIVDVNYMALLMQASSLEKQVYWSSFGSNYLFVPLMASIFYVLAVFGLPKTLSWKQAGGGSVLGAIVFVLALFSFDGILKGNWYFRNYYFPFSSIQQIRYVKDLEKTVAAHETIKENFSFEAKRSQNPQQDELYVLVIGETSRYDHWGVSGYHRATSPYVSKDSTIISFSKAFASASQTALSVPIMITPAEPENLTQHFQQLSMLSAFKEVGFHTSWISNQEIVGAGNYRIHMHAAEADTLHFLSPQKGMERPYDAALLPVLEGILKMGGKQLLVVHTYGSHHHFAERYPESFNAFQPAIKGKTNFGDEHEKIINAYDNSILYSDYILGQIIKKLKADNRMTAMVFMPDHGENLNDNGKGLYLHSNVHTKATAHVPLLVWLSESYQNKFPYKSALIHQRKDNPVSGSHIFHSMLGMASIDTPYYRDSLSLVSDTFSSTPPLLLSAGKVITPDAIKQ